MARVTIPPYLPSLPVKANILIDQAGHARLADFGLLTIISDPANHLSSSSYSPAGTFRWMSPERIAPEQFGFKNGHPTIPSDCYALGMVIYETISGNLPFHKYTDFQVYMKIVKGEQPHRGVRFTDDLWKMLEQCWTIQPGNRPSIEDVLTCLGTDSKLVVPQQPLYMDSWKWKKKSSILFFTRGRLGVKLLDAKNGQFEEIDDRGDLVRKELERWEASSSAPCHSSIMIQIHVGS